MKPTTDVIDALFIDKVLAARQRTFEQKFRAAGDLHEAVLERMRAGILMQSPNASEDEIQRELMRRFAIGRLLENSP
jgi:hypothetical protein